MHFEEVTGIVVVDAKFKSLVREEYQLLFDRLADLRIPIFRSDVTTKVVCSVDDEAELRREFEV